MALLYVAWIMFREWVRQKALFVVDHLMWCPRTHAPPPSPPPQPVTGRVYRAYAFKEEDDTSTTGDAEHDESTFYTAIPTYIFHDNHWEKLDERLATIVRRETGWSKYRVEVRYAFGANKYRMVLRPGDQATVLPWQSHDAPANGRGGIMSARLQGPIGSQLDCDVTSRVCKYQGARCDFHAWLGARVKVQDMFPFYDHDDNALRVSHLRVVDSDGQIHDFEYSKNPVIRFAKTKKTPSDTQSLAQSLAQSPAEGAPLDTDALLGTPPAAQGPS
jgi:hypothetical protein